MAGAAPAACRGAPCGAAARRRAPARGPALRARAGPARRRRPGAQGGRKTSCASPRLTGFARLSGLFDWFFRRLLRIGDIQTERTGSFMSLVPEGPALRRSHALELFGELELPLINFLQEFLNL